MSGSVQKWETRHVKSNMKDIPVLPLIICPHQKQDPKRNQPSTRSSPTKSYLTRRLTGIPITISDLFRVLFHRPLFILSGVHLGWGCRGHVEPVKRCCDMFVCMSIWGLGGGPKKSSSGVVVV